MRLTGLSSRELDALDALSPESRAAIVQVRVEGADAPMAGDVSTDEAGAKFTPQFPFDPGRRYVVRVDLPRLPAPRAAAQPFETVVALPARDTPRVRVAAISPASAEWPENTLRFYLYFSGPMSRETSAGRVRLLDAAGADVPEALLESDVDLWNAEYTRVTVLFDPGRVKRGIGPNLEMGRALRAGQSYAIAVSADWKDAAGRPLETPFRHVFRATAPIERPLDHLAWQIVAPASGARDALVVRVPWALDRALAERVIGVETAEGRAIDGIVAVDGRQTEWQFTPAEPWARGAYRLVADAVLEDPSGNRIGRAFETAGGAGTQGQTPDRYVRPFVVK
jgi:hypothetical protein